MENAVRVVGDWRSVKNYCSCCLSVGCYKDIKNEYYFGGKKEKYETMLQDTFNIQIQERPDKTSSLICESCVTRLRDATDFKTMVAQTEQILNTYHHVTTLQIKIENVDFQGRQDAPPTVLKMESDDDLDDNHQEDDSQFYDDEEQNLDAPELLDYLNADDTKCTEVNVPKQKRKRSKNVTLEKKRRTKENIKENKEKCKSDVKRLKLMERRGNAPIIRENSLKLIKNSTLCVFQWHKSRYRCFCCKEPFSDFNLLREHNNKEHTLRDIEKRIIVQQNAPVKCEISTLNCKICNAVIENIIELRKHLKNEHGIEFFLDEDLLVPFRIQDGDFTCQICCENFTAFRFLNIHMNKHYQKKICHVCGEGFPTLAFLHIHKIRCHRIYKCETCGITFDKRLDKITHDKKVHDVKLEKKLRFPCQFCDERFFHENLKMLHLVEKHGMKKPEHKCSHCPKVFITKSLRNGHVKNVHLKKRDRECEICHKAFYTKSDLSRHNVTHTGIKSFSCSICSTNFATKDSLRRHLKRTHNVGKKL